MSNVVSIEDVVKLPDEIVMAAMSNDPQDSNDWVEFAGKKYPIMHLKYRDYMAFIACVQPIIGSMIALVSGKAGQDTELETVVAACSDVFPNLVRLSLKQSDSSVSIAFIEDNATSPFELLEIITKQVKKNEMVNDFSRFFGQYKNLLPDDLLGRLTTRATPSS